MSRLPDPFLNSVFQAAAQRLLQEIGGGRRITAPPMG
jgi:hypothetical protein